MSTSNTDNTLFDIVNTVCGKFADNNSHKITEIINNNLDNISNRITTVINTVNDINNNVDINNNLDNISNRITTVINTVNDINNNVDINNNLDNISNRITTVINTVNDINKNVDIINNVDINNNVDIVNNVHKVVSWDVGIKNLSYCIMSYDKNAEDGSKFPIYEWDVINISEFEDSVVIAIICDRITKSGKRCNKVSKYIVKGNKKDIDDKYYCGMHCKSEVNRVLIKKKKTPKHPSILNLGLNMYHKLDKIPALLDVSEVVIENQPSLKAPMMKSVQMLLFSYYIMNGMRNTNSGINNIRMISASNKLKHCDPDLIDLKHIKSKYTRRKKLGVAYCKLLIKNDMKNTEYFMSNKKQDDLADSFLQGIYHLETKKSLK
jgi:hypothetical protein